MKLIVDNTKPSERFCTFCKKVESDCRSLVEGKSGKCICGECARKAKRMIEESDK